MNADFVRIAHRKAVWQALQRILLDKFIAQDAPPQEQLICEEVPYANKDVTNEALLEVLEIIQQHEVDEQLEMRQFEFRRRRPREELSNERNEPSNERHTGDHDSGKQPNEQASAASAKEAGAPSGNPNGEPVASSESGSSGGKRKQAG